MLVKKILTGSKTVFSSYCHIDDAVEAMYKLITNRKCYRQIFNIGNPSNKIDVLGLASMVNSLCRNEYTNIDYDDNSRCTTDINLRVPNINKIRDYIDWEPQKDLTSIIVDMMEVKQNG